MASHTTRPHTVAALEATYIELVNMAITEDRPDLVSRYVRDFDAQVARLAA